MAEQDRQQMTEEPEQQETPMQTGTDTRRTSTSSAGVRSAGLEQTESLQASQTSGHSETPRNRPRPQRLDYGKTHMRSLKGG